MFTTDTGMSTVWLARFVTMRGTRRLLGSFNLGSMANALPQALGAAAVDRQRQVVAFCGDGGLTMLLGDVLTAVAYELPAKLIVFDNGRLGMVKLEQEQGGLPEFGTELTNPDLSAVAAAMGMPAPGSPTPSVGGRRDDGARLAGPVSARRRHEPRGDRASAEDDHRSGVGVRDREGEGRDCEPGRQVLNKTARNSAI